MRSTRIQDAAQLSLEWGHGLSNSRRTLEINLTKQGMVQVLTDCVLFNSRILDDSRNPNQRQVSSLLVANTFWGNITLKFTFQSRQCHEDQKERELKVRLCNSVKIPTVVITNGGSKQESRHHLIELSKKRALISLLRTHHHGCSYAVQLKDPARGQKGLKETTLQKKSY